MNYSPTSKLLYFLIAGVSVLLFGYDLWMSIQMARTMGVPEVFADITFLSGKICDVQLPFYAFWIAAVWASFKRWNPFFIVVLLLSPFIVYSGISNFSLLHVLTSQTSIPVSWGTILFLSVSGGLRILLVVLVLLLIIKQLPAMIAAYKTRKAKKENVVRGKVDTLLIFIGIAGIILLLIQLFNCVVGASDMSYSITEMIEYCVVSPSLLLWILVIWAGLKRWSPIFVLLLLLSPLILIGGLIGLISFGEATSFLAKMLGMMQIILVILVIFTAYVFVRE